MSIEIKTKKVTTLGGDGRGRLIEGLSALSCDQLPEEYKNQVEAVVSKYNNTQIVVLDTYCNWTILRVGETYYEETFQEVLEKIKKAGQLLAQINTERAKRLVGWEGEETFVI